jgi:hypothetical protein
VADQVNCIVAPTISVGTLPPLPVIPAPILATVVPIPYEITVVPTVVPPKP